MNNSFIRTKKPVAVSFGEVLFDVFPDRARLGGAPLNLAVHLHRLGAETRLISALGADESGRIARAEILRQGLDDTDVAETPCETGQVTITLDTWKVPSYTFCGDCAWDHIPLPKRNASGTDLFCFGTLAQRGAESRKTLRALLKSADGLIFCDVNLRGNFYDSDILQESLNTADLVKLNAEELLVLGELFDLSPNPEALAEKFHLQTVIQTLGPHGCEIWHEGQIIRSPAIDRPIVSTVGAGDAFSAAFLYKRLTGGSIAEAAEAGNRLAAETAGHSGAF